MKILKLILVSSLYLGTADGCDMNGHTGFAPKNNMQIPVTKDTGLRHSFAPPDPITGLSKREFNQVIDEVFEVFTPIFDELGVKVVIQRNWDNGSVNAQTLLDKNFWGQPVANFGFFGGMARHPLMTKDGFAMVVCHEIGHHLGGAPKRSYEQVAWASSEGQSDYYAAMKCFKQVYENDDNRAILAEQKIEPDIKSRCERVYKSDAQIALCERTLYAGKSTSDMLHALALWIHDEKMKNHPSLVEPLSEKELLFPWFSRPLEDIVTVSNEGHPKAQCRLDTMTAGALCDKPLLEILSADDPNIGSCNRKDKDLEGLRPLCWYKPTI